MGKSLFAGIDRKMVVILAAIITLILVTFVAFTKPSSALLAEASLREAKATTAVDTVKRRVAEIQRDGTASIDTLITRLAVLEKALPNKGSDLNLASTLAASAASAGVKLLSFDPSADADAPASGVIAYSQYAFTIEGSPDAIVSWLQTTLRGSDQVITLAAARVNNVLTTSTTGNSALSGNVSMSGTLRIWYTTKPALTLAPGDTGSDLPVVDAPVVDTPAAGTPTDPGTNPAPNGN